MIIFSLLGNTVKHLRRKGLGVERRFGELRFSPSRMSRISGTTFRDGSGLDESPIGKRTTSDGKTQRFSIRFAPIRRSRSPRCDLRSVLQVFTLKIFIFIGALLLAIFLTIHFNVMIGNSKAKTIKKL